MRPINAVPMSKSFKIITLGCKVNQYESAFFKTELMKAGWVHVGRNEKSDVAIINTCIVTQKAGHQSRQEIRKAIRENPKGMTAAVGCYAQVYLDELKKIPGIGLIVGNAKKGRLIRHLISTIETGQQVSDVEDFQAGAAFECMPIKRFPDRTRAFLKIQDGCQSTCTYCIVPSARGPYRSLSSEKVLSSIQSLVSEGHKEIVLTGIHLGMYGIDLGTNMTLKRLLKAIAKEKLPVRIRLSSLEPNEIDEELIEMTASENWLCRHFHISLQSGDDRVLKRMKRHYTANAFAKLIETIHVKNPMTAIGIDVMAGFQGEDLRAHKNTYCLIRDLPISYLHVFPFSPRPGTAAVDIDGRVDPKIIKKRTDELRELGWRKKTSFYGSCLYKTFSVLAETWDSQEKKMRGTSDNYLPVLFTSTLDLTNHCVPVFIEKIRYSAVEGSVAGDYPYGAE